MRSQDAALDGIRKGLLQVYVRFFAASDYFVPIAFEDNQLFIVTSDISGEELSRFIDGISEDAHVIPASQELLAHARSQLIVNSHDEMSTEELQNFTDFAIRSAAQPPSEVTPVYCTKCGYLLSGMQNETCPGCQNSLD